MLYPKLISMNTRNFDYSQSNFTEKMMTRKDKKGVSREGAGRVAMAKDCPGLIHSYTLECNYCCGAVVNDLKERFDLEKRRYLADSEPIIDTNSNFYKNSPSSDFVVRYCIPVFKDIGRACLVAILDMTHSNP